MVLWKETAFPLCRAMERRWKRNVVSRVSSVIVVIRLPISCVSSMAISCHVPAVSMANEMGKRCVCWPILSIRTLYFYYYYYYCWRARATYRRVFDDGEFVLVAGEDGPVVVGVEHDDDDLERPGARRRPAAVDCPQPQPVLGPCLAVHALVQSQLHLPCIVLSCLRTLTTWHCPHSSAARRCCMQQPIDIS